MGTKFPRNPSKLNFETRKLIVIMRKIKNRSRHRCNLFIFLLTLKYFKLLRVNRNINKLHLCRLLFFIFLIIRINFLCYRIFLDLSWVNTSLQKVVFYLYSFFICVRKKIKKKKKKKKKSNAPCGDTPA